MKEGSIHLLSGEQRGALRATLRLTLTGIDVPEPNGSIASKTKRAESNANFQTRRNWQLVVND
jgi:hypothetical protein